MFKRIRFILAAFDRGEFDVHGLIERLDHYVDLLALDAKPSRKQTVTGLVPRLGGEP
jgi:hypothetical protein